MPSTSGPPPSVPELPSLDLRQRLDRGETLTLLDVREPGERAFCAIPCRGNVRRPAYPHAQIPAHLDEIQAAAAGGPLVVYCHHGIRSRHVAEWLADRGLTGILNLRGGIDAYSLETDPAVPRYH